MSARRICIFNAPDGGGRASVHVRVRPDGTAPRRQLSAREGVLGTKLGSRGSCLLGACGPSTRAGKRSPGCAREYLFCAGRDALASPGVHPPGRVRAWCGQVCAAKCIGGGVASAYGGIMPLMSEFSRRRL